MSRGFDARNRGGGSIDDAATPSRDLDTGGVTDGSERWRWFLVVALLLIYMYAFVDRVVLALLVDPIRHHFGASDAQMGLLLGLAFAVFYATLSVPAGYFIDRVNRRRLLGLASVLWAAMTICCGLASNLGELFLARSGVGLAEAAITPAAFSLIRDAVPPRRRGLAFSIFAMAPVMGGGLSLIGGGYILRAAEAGAFASIPLMKDLAPWQVTLMVIGLTGLPLSLLLLGVREPGRPGGIAASDKGLVRGVVDAARYVGAERRIYLPLILFVAFGAMSNFAASAWMPAIIGRRWGLPPAETGPILGVVALGSGVSGLIVSGLLLNRILARGGDIRVWGMVAAAGAMIGLIGAAAGPSLGVCVAFTGIAHFFMGTSYSVGATTLGQVTPAPLMGRVTSIYLLMQTLLGQALGPLAVTSFARLFEGNGAIAHGMAVAAPVFGAITITAALILRRNLRGMAR